MSDILNKLRLLTPEYKDVPDDELVSILHQEYTPNVPIQKVYDNLGVTNPEADGNFVRGLKEQVPVLKQAGYGILGGAGALGEYVAGEGGIATGIRKAGEKGFLEKQAELQETAKPSDDWDTVHAEAKAGDFSGMGDFIAHAAGAGLGQVGFAVATGGVGGMAGKVIAKEAFTGMMERATAAQAEKLLATNASEIAAGKTAQALTQESATKIASDIVANKVKDYAATGAVMAMGTGQEAGEIGGTLTTENTGKVLTGEQLSKGLAYSLAAGGLEGLSDVLGLKAITGKLPMSKAIAGMEGITGKVARGALGGLEAAPIEGLTELGQTFLERAGEGKEVFTPEGWKEARTAAAQGAFGGQAVGIVGGLLSKAKNVDEAIDGANNELESHTNNLNATLALPAPAQKIEDKQGGLVQSDLIKFNDGSETTAGDFYANRLATHGNPELAKAETLIARNGTQPKLPIGIPQLIFTANGEALNKSEVINGFIKNGLTSQEAEEYTNKIQSLPVEERTPINLDPYRFIQERNANTTAPTIEQPAQEKGILGSPSVVPKKTGIGALTEFEQLVNEEAQDKALRLKSLIEKQKLQKESALETLNNTVGTEQQKASLKDRLNILDNVLTDDSIPNENKQAKFEADIKRAGYHDTNLTDFEKEHLKNHINFLNEKEALEANRIPSSPNELILEDKKKAPDTNKVTLSAPEIKLTTPKTEADTSKATVSKSTPELKAVGIAITKAAKTENRTVSDMAGMYSHGSEHQGVDIHSISQTKDESGNNDYVVHLSRHNRTASNGHKTTEGKYSLNKLLNSGAISQSTYDFLVNEHNESQNDLGVSSKDHELTAQEYVDREVKNKKITPNKAINDSLRKSHYTEVRSHLDQGGKISQAVFDSLDGLKRANLIKNYGEDIIENKSKENGNAEQKQETTPTNGSGSAQSGVRQEGEDTSESGQGVRSSGQEKGNTGVISEISKGNDVELITPKNDMQVDAHYAIVSLDSLITSHNTSLNINPAFPQEMQPRNRSAKSYLLDLQNKVAKFNPRLVGESNTTDTGAPLVTDKGIVISGNGRTIALNKIYAENKEKFAEYKNWLIDNFEKFGVDKESISGTKNPVLVRIIDNKKIDLLDLSRKSNEVSIKEMSVVEQAFSDASQIDDEIFTLYDGGTLATNKRFLTQFIQATNADNIYDEDGFLSQKGIVRIESAIMAKAYNNNKVVADLYENADTEVKSILNGLLKASSEWIKLRSAFAMTGTEDITDRLTEAVMLVKKARATKNQTVKSLIDQVDMFSGNAVHPITEKFVKLFFYDPLLTRYISGEKVGGILTETAKNISKQLVNTDVFGENLTPSQVLDEIYGLYVKEKNNPTGQVPQGYLGDLFNPVTLRGDRESQNESGKRESGQGVNQVGNGNTEELIKTFTTLGKFNTLKNDHPQKDLINLVQERWVDILDDKGYMGNDPKNGQIIKYETGCK